MTRFENIEKIKAQLASLDDDRVQAVADLVQSFGAGGLKRQLSDREIELLERAKAAVATGQSMSLEEMDAYLDAARARRASART